MKKLKFLLNEFNEKEFKHLKNLQILISSKRKFCCYFENQKSLKSCTPKEKKGMSSCSELIKSNFLKVLLYFFSILTIFFNFFNLILKFHNFEQSNQLMKMTLNFADLLLAVYFLIIMIKDIEYSGKYFKFDEEWRNSVLCKFLGVFASTGCLLSHFSLLVMTIERFLAINSKVQSRHLTMLKLFFIAIFLCLISVFLSIIPIFTFKVKFFA